MGCWSVSCGISNIAITAGQECCILPLYKDKYDERFKYSPAMLPIFGEYNDYGGLENIVENENTKLIESYTGLSIQEFCDYLTGGDYTYKRSEVETIKGKMKNIDKLDLRFIWIDKKVYDFMSKTLVDKNYYKLGKHELLTLLGFTKTGSTSDIRHKHEYTKDNLVVHSDETYLISKDGQSIFYVLGDSPYSLEYYIAIPDNLRWLGEHSEHDIWYLYDDMEQKRILYHAFGRKYKDVTMRLDYKYLMHVIEISGKDLPDDLNPEKIDIVYRYFKKLSVFGKDIRALLNVKTNLYPMSGTLRPYELYLTPQCGERDIHDKLLQEFVKINQSYNKLRRCSTTG